MEAEGREAHPIDSFIHGERSSPSTPDWNNYRSASLPSRTAFSISRKP
jgi:hypothetical protein